MTRRDAIRSEGWSPAQPCKKNEKTAIGVIATTTAVKLTPSSIKRKKTTRNAATKPLVTT